MSITVKILKRALGGRPLDQPRHARHVGAAANARAPELLRGTLVVMDQIVELERIDLAGVERDEQHDDEDEDRNDLEDGHDPVDDGRVADPPRDEVVEEPDADRAQRHREDGVAVAEGREERAEGRADERIELLEIRLAARRAGEYHRHNHPLVIGMEQNA